MGDILLRQLKLPLEDRVLLRLREVHQCFPNITTQELRKWEAAGIVRVLRTGPRSHRWYYTKELICLAKKE